MRVRLRKAIRDLINERFRALLVLAALIVGGWGIGSVIASTTVLIREVRENYKTTNPRHATITYRGEGDVVAAAESAVWVTEAERRTSIDARAKGGFDGRLFVRLFVVDDFDHQKIARFTLESGHWPQPGEITLERDDLTVLGLETAPPTLTLQLPGGEWIDFPVAGTVHDPGQAPARMEHMLYVYCPRETAESLGASLETQDVLVRMAAPAVSTRELARDHAQLLGQHIEQSGFELITMQVPEPEQHPHQGQMTSMLFMQFAYGGLSMLLSGVVIINMISSLMQRHIAQIGVCKTIGGTTWQIGCQYLLMVLLLSAVAMIMTIPLGVSSGMRYGKFVTEQLNLELLTRGIPAYGWGLFLAASLGLPLLAAIAPVWRGTRVSVCEALRSSRGKAIGVAEYIARVPSLPKSLRNIARRPGRTALTIFSLAVGFAALGSAFHVGASMRRTMEMVTQNTPYDLLLSFRNAMDRDDVATALAKLDDVIDSWDALYGTTAQLIDSTGREGDPFSVLAADPLSAPASAVVAGQWRLPPEGRALIVPASFASANELSVGDVVTLRIDGEDARWPIEGIIRTIGGHPCYLLSRVPMEFEGIRGVTITLTSPSREALEQAMGAPVHLFHGPTTAPALVTAIAKYQALMADRVELALEEARIPVSLGSTKAEIVAGLEDHIFVMTRQVALASLIILGVGALGLAAAMSVSVLERTREIGVLRSLGATPSRLARVFASECAAIGAISLAIGIVASYPIGRLISNHFGNMMFHTPLDAGTSLRGVYWGIAVIAVLVIVVTAIVLAQTLRQTTTAALRYE